MNLIAVDIGNTNAALALYIDDKEHTVESVNLKDQAGIEKLLSNLWSNVPVSRISKENKKDGIIVVSSVNPPATETIRKIVKEKLDEKILLIPEDIPYPIELSIEEPDQIGSDRILAAVAAYSVTEHAVAVADIGTAVTIDLVDDKGVFAGGVILPGFELCAKALNEHTALLPKIDIEKPKLPFGKNTTEAINAGLYYSVLGALEEIIRRYAEVIGTWPQTIITGSAAELIKDDCGFIDSYVPNLVVKGIALAYRKYIDNQV